LRAGAKVLHSAVAVYRPSVIDSDGFGAGVSRGGIDGFERYWVPGVSAVTESFAALGDALKAAADSCEQRDAADAERFRSGGGEYFGF
jgi:hypothetical protein